MLTSIANMFLSPDSALFQLMYFPVHTILMALIPRIWAILKKLGEIFLNIRCGPTVEVTIFIVHI